MKSVLIVSGITFPEIGGVSNYVDFLTHHLDNCEVLSFNFYNQKKSQVRMVNGKKYYLLRKVYFGSTKISFPLRILIMAYFIRKLSNNRIIYAQDIGIAGLSSLLSMKPFILRFVGDWAYESYYSNKLLAIPYLEFLHSSHAKLKKFLTKFILLKAKRIITPARHLKEVLVKYYTIKPNKISIVENVINLPQKPHINKKKQQLVFVGRVIALKRLDIALKIYLESKKHIPSISLVVVGDGYLLNTYKRIVKNAGIKDVHFVGKKPKHELVKDIGQSKALVLTSIYEGTPFVALESLYLGTCALCYNNPGTNELSSLVNGMELFDSIEEGVEKLLKIMECRVSGEAIQALANRFSKQNHLKKLTAIIYRGP